MDLTTLTEEELEQLRIDVLTEQERRADLARIPDQIEELRQRFITGGGDPAELD